MAAELINDWWRVPTEWLSTEHELHNATLIYNHFTSQDWTPNAVCGMLGNMHKESTCNPARWQGKSVPSNPLTTSKAFGLTQWHPANKYIVWALDEGYSDYADGWAQLSRIEWERANKKQWSLNNLGGMRWDEYCHSTYPPERLAQVFFWAYERASGADLAERKQYARYFYDYFNPPEPGPDPDPGPWPGPVDPDNPDHRDNGFSFNDFICCLSYLNSRKRVNKNVRYL